MRAVAMSYATAAFADYQRVWAASAAKCDFDEVRTFGPGDLDAGFVARHAETLASPHGAGYWLWKPHLIARTLSGLDDGDVLFYSDAAAHFVAAIDPAVELMDELGLDLLLMGEAFVERQYTKRDAFVLTGCDGERFSTTPQRFASIAALRRSAWSLRLAKRYLEHCEDPRVLTDRPNELGLPNYPGFVAHRHDQSVLSLLSKDEGIAVPVTPFVADGLAPRGEQLVNHTRTRHTPAAVLHHLLSIGLLGMGDVSDLADVAPNVS